ncbi:MAG TPA: site-specific DNA-methyltransferase [Candidatus Angelobacter sp.]|jgi:adenine-specific DNA-methyltransferase
MEKLKLHTPDLAAQNVEKLAQLFPNCISEVRDEQGKVTQAIDFDQLRQELSGSIVEGPRERYHLDWPGKREAILAANAPIAKTLRPCREESVDFDTTKNLFIEGDNLDALKLLQETYLGKVKLIYIDPPYNTGNDLLYEDDFAGDKEAYLLRSNQEDEIGNRLTANADANGRFHSDWLTMLYPRLKLARNLLSDDGLIMISIDDHELSNLRHLGDELFGSESFLIQFVWQRRSMADSRNQDRASSDHEYVVCYKRPGAKLKGRPIDKDKYANPDNDPRGSWFSADLTGIANKEERPNLHYDLVNSATGSSYPPSPTRGWSYSPETMAKMIVENRVLWPSKPDGRPRHKKFLNEVTRHETGFSSWLDDVGQTSEGTQTIQELFGEKVFPFAKPLSLMRTLVEQATQGEENVILDFFAGSGTTGHAVYEQNSVDGAKRRFILVQLPEPIQREGYKTLAELTKERLRRGGAMVKSALPLKSQDLDTGFRVLKIDASNMRDVYYAPDVVAQGELLAQVDNIRADRTPEDLLFQVLVDWGIDLALPITQNTIDGKTVFFVDGNALAACFDTGVNDELVKEIARRKPLRAVFRDASYGSDSVKINVDQIFRLLSPETEVRSI